MSRIQTVELREGRTDAIVIADLVTLKAKHVQDYEQVWQAVLQELGAEDRDLSWQYKKQLAERHPYHEAYAIEYEDLTQGMILLETQNHWSLFIPGQRIVYVENVVSAPWNRKWVQRPQELKDVGRSLLKFAQQRSRELGYGGAVGLYSLPEAVRFYDHLGMMCLELDPADITDPEENLSYFEYRVQRNRGSRDYDE